MNSVETRVTAQSNSLTPAQRDDLRAIAAMMIPESAEYRVPGADDPVIQTDILATLGRDTDRVLRSLGLELRPPFPKGYTLEQGDWSLLDPVKARPSMWRRVP